jgi:hypothetical protein
LRHENKIRSSTATGGHINEAQGWFEGSSYYVSIAFSGSQIGLLVVTEDEDEARQEVDEFCTSLSGGARSLFVRKVVLQ